MKGQLVAIALIVACGVAMMIASLGAMKSLRVSQQAYYAEYRFADIFADFKRAPLRLLPEITDIEGVRSSYAQIVGVATLDIPGIIEPASAQLVSLPRSGRPVLNDIILLEGRVPSVGRAMEVLANDAFMKAHDYKIGTIIEAKINGTRQSLVIVGRAASPEYIYTLPPGGLVPDEKRFGIFWTNIENLETLYDLEGGINSLRLSLDEDANTQKVIDTLDRMLKRYGNIGAYDRVDQVSHAFIDAELQQLATMARVMPPIFLVVAAVLLNIIMSRLIDTEREEIGLLKAFGYTDEEVARHYLKLAMLVAVLGVVFGYIAGTWLARTLTELYANFFHFPAFVYRESKTAVILASLFSLAAAGIAVVNAIWRAASIAPAQAMQPQPPTVYKANLWEIVGASRLLDKPTQMVIRHIFRWPGRSMVTILGIGAAQGLLIGTLYSFDAVEEIVDLYFIKGASHDLFIQFIEPVPVTTIASIRKLPGVISVEPSRDLAVKFSNEHYEESSYITGLDDSTTLKRIYTDDMRRIFVPKNGLLISDVLARKLSVNQGDLLTMEVVTGRQPVISAPIAGIISEHIGLPAYAHRTFLNSTMREGEVISGVFVRTDSSRLTAFYDQINKIPAVSAVLLQDVAYKSFRATLAETITIMMNVYKVVGSLIAIGVIYNAARISLSERRRELASLHILGFSHWQVSYVLIGELVLLALFSLPIGCALGYVLAFATSSAMSTDLYRIPLVINASTYGSAILIILSSVLISAGIIYWQIRNLDMIETLKSRD